MREKILFTWSGGKDSALAFYELIRGDLFEVAALLTTVTRTYDRISMHGVRRSLVEKQAESLGLPLEIVYLSSESSEEDYEKAMTDVLLEYRHQGISSVAFGDIHLRDIREYRERHLARVDMRGLFPLWVEDTAMLAQSFIHEGFKAVVTCVDTRRLDRSFVGRMIDKGFLASLPPEVDPCGENGEYHSFVFDAPMFERPIPCETGEVVVRDSFCFCDVLPTLDRAEEGRVTTGCCPNRISSNG